VTVGDDTWLNCSTDHGRIPVIWNRYAQDNTKIVVYRLGQIHQEFRQRCEVEPAVKGHYNLVIANVQLTDEGLYECKDRAGLGESKKAYLSVRSKITFQQTPGNHVLLISLRCVNSKYKVTN